MNKRRKPLKVVSTLLGILLGLVVIIHLVSLFTIDRRVEYKELSFYSANLPEELSGYRIAFVTDIHALPVQDMERIVEELNLKQIDLLILGGDFPSETATLREMMEILSRAKTTDGVYGVQGNHDNFQQLSTAMEQYGIVTLSNNGVYTRGHLYLAGTKDLWTRQASIEQAIQDATSEDFILLISHNPDITMQQSTSGVDLILCGHTHGGHVTVFGLWAPALAHTRIITDYGQRFMSGWALSTDNVPVYVSRGVGVFETIPRVFARPEVVLLTLYSE